MAAAQPARCQRSSRAYERGCFTLEKTRPKRGAERPRLPIAAPAAEDATPLGGRCLVPFRTRFPATELGERSTPDPLRRKVIVKVVIGVWGLSRIRKRRVVLPRTALTRARGIERRTGGAAGVVGGTVCAVVRTPVEKQPALDALDFACAGDEGFRRHCCGT